LHIVEHIRKINDFHGKLGLTIGNFEGFHRGHREIITTLLEQSLSRGLHPAVITFKEHPLRMLRGFEPERLSLPHEKLVNLKKAGVFLLFYLDFSPEFADTTPEGFLHMLKSTLAPGMLCLGRQFRFGRGNKGDIGFLGRKASVFGYDLVVVEDVMYENVAVSSTRIRDSVKRGDFELADALLGHKYHLYVTGDGSLLKPLCMNCAFPVAGRYRAVLFEGGNKQGTGLLVKRVEQGFEIRNDIQLDDHALYRLQFSHRVHE
jgi:riboflavin kinase/FMN adenylyltransferase